ncbi:hypothetical protein [Priestia megaterium]|uniref:hypothetical protein n=1 Tax=Priestia megaterium TaxID=1404 RepID=UPI0030036CEF
MNNELELDHLFESPKEWINALPAYQKNMVNKLIENTNNLDDAAAQYFNFSTPNTAPFGAGGKKDLFIENAKKEFYRYICGDEKYTGQRQTLMSGLKPLHTTVVSSISTAISSNIGASQVYLAPIIVIFLMGVSTIGKNAWCITYAPEDTGGNQ